MLYFLSYFTFLVSLKLLFSLVLFLHDPQAFHFLLLCSYDVLTRILAVLQAERHISLCFPTVWSCTLSLSILLSFSVSELRDPEVMGSVEQRREHFCFAHMKTKIKLSKLRRLHLRLEAQLLTCGDITVCTCKQSDFGGEYNDYIFGII